MRFLRSALNYVLLITPYNLQDSEATLTLSLSDGALYGDPRIRKSFKRDATGKVIRFIERLEMRDISWVKSV